MPLATPYITYVGSDSGCGCEFRYALKEQHGWTPVAGEDEMQDKSIKNNQDSLFKYITSNVSEGSVQLYGCWDGDYDEQAESTEVIAIEEILDKDFYFKERGFYSITISG